MKLTKTKIDRFTYEGNNNSRDIRWGDNPHGLGLRIYPSGRKAFILSYRVNGRKRLLTLGTYGVITLDEAQKKARKAIGNLDTNDPLEERQKATQGETVKELCRAYLERHAKVEKKSWQDDERRINNRIIPLWGNLKAINIKRSDVAAIHSKIGKNHRYEANRLLALISKIFELGRVWGFTPDNHINPAGDIDHFKEKKRDRWVTHEELPKLAEAIDEEANIHAKYALWLYLLTGARKTEILTAKWNDLDWTRKELRLPDTKSGNSHTIPLSEAALAILKRIPRIDGNPHIIPGLKTGSHLVNISKPWSRVRSSATVKLWAENNDKAASLIETLTKALERQPSTKEVRNAATFDLPSGMEDVRLHDLRRTVGSWLAQSGNSLHLIGRVLNHTNQSTTAIYARLGQDQAREALEQHGTQILNVAKGEKAEIVTLKSIK